MLRRGPDSPGQFANRAVDSDSAQTSFHALAG
jgi:hypothetical protein